MLVNFGPRIVFGKLLPKPKWCVKLEVIRFSGRVNIYRSAVVTPWPWKLG